MFLPDYSDISGIRGDDAYHQHLFEKEPFVFIGTHQDLVSKYSQLNKIHKETYGTELQNNLDMWNDGKDISRKSDLKIVINDLSYAMKKGSPYLKLHMLLRHKSYM